jgi:hypothetical protein
VVRAYDLTGRPDRVIGQHGSTPGDLAFPVDVAVSRDGLVLVLDQARFNVVCYAPDGKFLGEFGGKGVSPGWFYRPSLLAIDRDDRVYIGQIFMNRLQVCRIPDFIAMSSSNRGLVGRREDRGVREERSLRGMDVPFPAVRARLNAKP